VVNTYQLPVSAIRVNLRQLAGDEEVLLAESKVGDAALAIALVQKLALAADESAIDWEELPISDLDAALMLIRQLTFGDSIRADVVCPMNECGKRIDLRFGVQDYLEHHKPRWSRDVETGDRDGWARLRGSSASFRVPTSADEMAVASLPNSYRELKRRCVEPADAPAPVMRRVERAMEMIAPNLARQLSGKCPECGAQFEVFFDPRAFVLRELRDEAAYVYEDINLLASSYHWSEAEILRMPRERRVKCAELIRDSGASLG